MVIKNRVLLIYPAPEAGQMDLIPLSLLYIAQPLLENKIDVEIIDQRFEKDFPGALSNCLGPDLICIGMTCITGPQIDRVKSISRFIRERSNVPVVIGGTHATILPEQTLASDLVDYVVLGRGEAPFLSLVRAMKHGRPVRGLPQTGSKEGGQAEVNRNPAPAARTGTVPYSLVLKYGSPSVIPIVSSFGCPCHCSFCAEKILHPQYAEVPLDDVLLMIQDALRFRPQLINFFDANFLLHTQRVQELFSLCRRCGLSFEAICSSRVDSVLGMEQESLRDLRRQGIVGIFFGVESGSEKILRLINKGITPEMVILLNRKLREAGIKPHYSFMAGFPGETKADLEKTMDLIGRLKRDNPRAVIWKLNSYTPYPGTALFEVALQEGFVPPGSFEDWSGVHFYARDYAAPYDLRLAQVNDAQETADHGSGL
jgi:anaerobic magnesium-protoporphyrin IX monomethyl ester cyclase